MALQITLPKKPTKLDSIILQLTTFLLDRFGDVIVRVERIDGWDGCNVRIVVRDLGRMCEIIDAIAEFEEEKNIAGAIIPDVVSVDEEA